MRKKSRVEVECACGCGTKFTDLDSEGRPRTFLNGHNGRRYHGKEAESWGRNKRWKKNRPQIVREGKRRYYRRRKIMAMEYCGNACKICSVKYNGENAPIFEFHHREPKDKVVEVGVLMRNATWEKTLTELVKCDMLCANCHNQHHGGKW